ncbi:MAG: hypothetical protein IJD04_02680 [Desulfovibrionaceae bacterium]|nr:hypothetical protein [Desulfovibrionaceae bacterium]
MKKTLISLCGAALLALSAGPVWADSFLTLGKTPLRSSPSLGSDALITTDRGWLLHGCPVGDSAPGWYEVTEFLKEVGKGFAYVHMSFPQAAGYAYIEAEDILLVPDQGEKVFPSEDAYTPSGDSEGLIPLGTGNIKLPFGWNSLPYLHQADFTPVFTAEPSQGTVNGAPCGIIFNTMEKDQVNSWQYAVRATVETDGRSLPMTGTLTLKKAADFDRDAPGMENAFTGQPGRSTLPLIVNGFVSADLDLQEADGAGRLKGILTAYYRYSDTGFEVRLNNLPKHLDNPHYRNLFFTGEWLAASSRQEPARGGAEPLQKFKEVNGKLWKMLTYADNMGYHALILSHRPDYQSTPDPAYPDFICGNGDLYAYNYLDESGGPTLIWQIHDYVHDCEASVTTEFAEENPVITDLDGNGVSEVWIVYYIGCRGDISPEGMKIIMFEGSRKYALRGETLIQMPGMEMGGDYEADPAFNSAPPAFLQYARQLWQKNMRR